MENEIIQAANNAIKPRSTTGTYQCSQKILRQLQKSG